MGQLIAHEANAAATTSGFDAATFSKARAGPSGRRPCSQFRSVAKLTPIMRANSVCDFPREVVTVHDPRVATVQARIGLGAAVPELFG
jgi:hypothetical protein